VASFLFSELQNIDDLSLLNLNELCKMIHKTRTFISKELIATMVIDYISLLVRSEKKVVMIILQLYNHIYKEIF